MYKANTFPTAKPRNLLGVAQNGGKIYTKNKEIRPLTSHGEQETFRTIITTKQ